MQEGTIVASSAINRRCEVVLIVDDDSDGCWHGVVELCGKSSFWLLRWCQVGFENFSRCVSR